ncbi:MAG: tyrosine-type recombinase/integrase [Roseburia sp.]|nr:tyrosine-type recombinase/integrase [Roseburia sp.]
MKKIITEELLEQYETYLYEEEKRPATIKKYVADVRKLQAFAQGQEITKKRMIEFKAYLMEERQYKERSVNSFLVASNCFLQFMGWNDAKVRLNRIQNEIFCQEERFLSKEEYKKLVRTAKQSGKERLAMILQTIAATGMRIGELKFVTVEAVRRGCLEIRNKGKFRKVLLPKQLKISLIKYVKSREIESGMVFITVNGSAVDRSNIWREMKMLCTKAGVREEKVFPHNLRHLFAKCFYELEKDIAKLADVLGHSNIETTRIYIKETGIRHLRQLEKMGMVFG